MADEPKMSDEELVVIRGECIDLMREIFKPPVFNHWFTEWCACREVAFVCSPFFTGAHEVAGDENIFQVRNQLWQAASRLLDKGECIPDHPGADCTDAAHPAWWRGQEWGVKSLCQKINRILDGTEDCSGVCREPWESTRRRLMTLRDKGEGQVTKEEPTP